MHANVGDVIFTDGTEAAVVLAHATDDQGNVEGLIVGRFNSIEQVPVGDYGAVPGAPSDPDAADRPAEPVFAPTVGGETAEPIAAPPTEDALQAGWPADNTASTPAEPNWPNQG